MTEHDATMDRMLDGNAAAGPLAELFGMDMTMAEATCATCRHTAPLAAHHLYGDAPALVVRCPHCTSVILRYASSGRRLRLDMTGTRLLTVTPTTDEAAERFGSTLDLA